MSSRSVPATRLEGHPAYDEMVLRLWGREPTGEEVDRARAVIDARRADRVA